MLKETEEDLLAEAQQLRAEHGYLKNLQVLVLENRRRQRPKTPIVQNCGKNSRELLPIVQLLCATFYYHLKRMNRVDKHKASKEEIAAIRHENGG